MTLFWRFIISDHLFHAFDSEAKDSLCGYHSTNKRREAIASAEDIPEEILCPFCRSILKQIQRQRRAVLGPSVSSDGLSDQTEQAKKDH